MRHTNLDFLSDTSIKEIISLSELHEAYAEKEFMDYLLNHMASLIFIADQDSHFVYVNDAVVQKYQYSKEELLNMTISDIDINFDISKMDSFWKIFALQKAMHFQSIHKDKNGRLYPVLIHTHYIEYKNTVYAFGVIEDESYIQKLLDAHNGLITLTDGERLLMTNSKTLAFFGYLNFSDFLSEHNCVCNFYLEEDGFIHKQSTWIEDVKQTQDPKVKIKKPDTGEDYIFLVNASTFDENRTLVTYTDITYLEKNKNDLELLAITDGMTSLYNRRYFNQILPKEINRIKREHKKFAFIMIDIDFFKQYNDTYGHLKGDDVLIAVASTIKKHFNRASDFCFRLGGEEFGIICSINSSDTIAQQAEELRREIEILHIEHKSSSVFSFITVSIGVTLCDGSQSAETLYSKTDIELYKAKESGRNKVSVNFK